MTTYCRLCGESKDTNDLNCSIGDENSEIKVKLMACCQWHLHDTNTHFPQTICFGCVEKLEKCWLFNDSVAKAQIKLLEIFGEFVPIKCEVNIDDENVDEDIFVEPIPIPVVPADIDKEDLSPGTSIDSIDNEVSSGRQSHECDICQKIFTTAYNLNVIYVHFKSIFF